MAKAAGAVVGIAGLNGAGHRDRTGVVGGGRRAALWRFRRKEGIPHTGCVDMARFAALE
jgi:hypothetical protein